MEKVCSFDRTKNRGVTASARAKIQTYRKRKKRNDPSIEAANACNPTTASVDISTNNNDPVEVFEQEFLVEHISTSKDILGSNACGHETTDFEVDDMMKLK
ncbi:hypothetical protein Leryth_018049 [Lithospermum erythrorhizon]|nr:hypothetical protein Leryth_018049 [Lithospermum erythrorhizon]